MMLTLALWVALVGSPSWSARPEPSQQLQFRFEVAPAKRVFARLSETLGENHEAAPGVADDLLFLDIKGASAEEIRSRIAWALSASWSKEEAGWVLRRSARQSEEEWERMLKQREQGLKNAFAKFELQAGLPQFSESDAEALIARIQSEAQRPRTDYRARYEARMSISRQLPEGRLSQRLMAAFDPAVFNALPLNEATVLSSQPNSMQRRLPFSVAQALDAFQKEYSVWQKALASLPEPDEEDEEAMAQTYNPMGSFLMKRPALNRPLAKVNVVVENYADSIQLGIQILDGDQNVIADEWESVTLMDPFYEAMVSGGDLAGSGEKFVFGENSKNLIDHMSHEWRQMEEDEPTPAPPLSPEVRQMLLRPESNDPASWLLTEVLTGYSKFLDKNVVIAPRDLFYMCLVLTAESGINPQVCERIVLSPSLFERATEGEWLQARLWNAPLVRKHRTSRTALGKALRAADGLGYPTADILSEFATANPVPDPADYLSSEWIPSLLQPEMSDTWDQVSYNNAVLRLFGSLTPAQRSRMAAAPVSLGSLSPQQRQLIARAVFAERELMPFVDEEIDIELAESEEGQFWRTDEPTELFPTGLPSEGTVQLEVETLSGAMVSYGGEGSRSFMSAEDLAYYELLRTDPKFREEMEDEPVELGPMWVARQHTFEFSFVFGVNVTGSLSFDVTEFDKRDIPSIAQLPAAILQEIRVHMQNLKSGAIPPRPQR